MMKPLRPSLPYIMDLETGISFPRDGALLNHKPCPVSREALQRRAYSHWEKKGRPNDRGVANWPGGRNGLRPSSPLRVRGIPGVRLEPFAGGKHLSARAGERVPAGAQVSGPSPLCHEAMGDDVRDYAFHLYVRSGCDQAQVAECWREAWLCLDARIPGTALAARRN
jgi:hypothetical protein